MGHSFNIDLYNREIDLIILYVTYFKRLYFIGSSEVSLRENPSISIPMI